MFQWLKPQQRKLPLTMRCLKCQTTTITKVKIIDTHTDGKIVSTRCKSCGSLVEYVVHYHLQHYVSPTVKVTTSTRHGYMLPNW